MTELTTTERVLATREAGNVRRCHVVPHHGEYTVGKHSYDAASLLCVLHPNPSANLIKAVLWHDGAERWLGDMPAPAKWWDVELGRIYEKTEERVLRLWGLSVSLTDEELSWLRAVDRIELLLWCLDQQKLGNHHIDTFVVHLNRYFDENMDDMPQQCQDFLASFEWQRLPESKEEFKYRA